MRDPWYADTRVAAVAVLMWATGFGLGAQWVGRLAKPSIGRFEEVPGWIHTVKQGTMFALGVALVSMALLLYLEYRHGEY